MRKIKKYLNKWMEGLILIGGVSLILLLPPGQEITFLKVLGTLILIAFSVAILFLYFGKFIRKKIRLLFFLLLRSYKNSDEIKRKYYKVVCFYRR